MGLNDLSEMGKRARRLGIWEGNFQRGVDLDVMIEYPEDSLTHASASFER